MNSVSAPSRLLLFALVLSLSSCAGYQLGSVKPANLEHIQSIAIPTFKNLTLEPRSSVLMTNSVIKGFHEDGTFKTADELRALAKEEAGLWLKIEVSTEPVGAGATDREVGFHSQLVLHAPAWPGAATTTALGSRG